MARVMWTGGAPVVLHEKTYTPANVNIGNTFTLTINGKGVTFTATAATVANVTAGLTEAAQASPEGEFAELTFEDETTLIRVTGRDNGEQFTITPSAAGGTATLTEGSVNNGTGPNFANDGKNWSSGAVPAAGDDIVIDNSDVSILYGLLTNAPATVTVGMGFVGTIGLPTRNPGGYLEYRLTVVNFGHSPIYNVGVGDGPGSGRMKIKVNGTNTTWNVHNTGGAIDPGLPALRISGTTTGHTVNVMGGTVGVGVDGVFEPMAAVATVLVGPGGSFRAGVDSGTPITTLSVSGGTVVLERPSGVVTTLTMVGGDVTVRGDVAPGVANVDGGTLHYRSTGTIGTLRVSDGGVVDFGEDIRSRTVSACTVNTGAAVRDPYSTVTWTTGIVLNRCALADLTELDVGTHKTVTVTAGP